MTSLCLLVIPQLNKLFVYKNPLYESLGSLKDERFYQLKFYSPFMNPKHILEIGKSVDTLQLLNKEIATPPQENFVVLSASIIEESFFVPGIKNLTLHNTLYFDPENSEEKFYLYLVERQ